MEVGLMYNFNQTQNIRMVDHKANSDFDLFKLTSQMSHSLYENKVSGLNEVCEKLANLPFLFGVGLENTDDMATLSSSYRSAEEASRIHQSIQTIPIYHEVL